MELDPIDAFLSTITGQDNQAPQSQSLLQQGGNQSLGNISTLQVGYGNIAMYVDRQGIRIGSTNFASAPFSVDMQGNLKANSAKIPTYRQEFLSTVTFAESGGSPNTIETWTSGTVFLSNATTYSISSGSTGTLSFPGTHYFYIDPAISTTVVQNTTTPANAVGVNKIVLYVVTLDAGQLVTSRVTVQG